jgi:futalosine hydrolase
MSDRSILIVAATEYEIKTVLNEFKISTYGIEQLAHSDISFNIAALITGVGMVNTAYKMGRYSNNLYDYTINAGICGAFNKELKIGEAVNVVTDTLCEMGAENGAEFIKYNDLGLGGENTYTNNIVDEHLKLKHLKSVNGITVNKVHGNDLSISQTQALFHPDIESMEGAAFYRSCERMNGSYFQVRSVSNYVEKRDKSKWNIPLAIANLNNELLAIIHQIQHNHE